YPHHGPSPVRTCHEGHARNAFMTRAATPSTVAIPCPTSALSSLSTAIAKSPPSARIRPALPTTHRSLDTRLSQPCFSSTRSASHAAALLPPSRPAATPPMSRSSCPRSRAASGPRPDTSAFISLTCSSAVVSVIPQQYRSTHVPGVPRVCRMPSFLPASVNAGAPPILAQSRSAAWLSL